MLESLPLHVVNVTETTATGRPIVNASIGRLKGLVVVNLRTPRFRVLFFLAGV